jgi:hypothetical protein
MFNGRSRLVVSADVLQAAMQDYLNNKIYGNSHIRVVDSAWNPDDDEMTFWLEPPAPEPKKK